MKKHFTLIAMFSLIPLQAQAGCTGTQGFNDFDFWLGKWSVSANEQTVGTNHIKAIEGHCALIENWQGIKGGTGTSLNIFNPLKREWRQIWVAEAGYMIDIAGGLNKTGEMILEGNIIYYNNANTIPFKGTWTPMPDGRVRQYFQQWNNEKNIWEDWFDGLYQKIEQE